MELLKGLGIETPLAMVLGGGLIVLWRYFITREKTYSESRHYYQDQIQLLMKINYEHAGNLEELIQRLKDNDSAIECGNWFINKHHPTIKSCGDCKDYNICVHPRKPNLD